jgi:hypothetical protein
LSMSSKLQGRLGAKAPSATVLVAALAEVIFIEPTIPGKVVDSTAPASPTPPNLKKSLRLMPWARLAVGYSR